MYILAGVLVSISSAVGLGGVLSNTPRDDSSRSAEIGYDRGPMCEYVHSKPSPNSLRRPSLMRHLSLAQPLRQPSLRSLVVGISMIALIVPSTLAQEPLAETAAANPSAVNPSAGNQPAANSPAVNSALFTVADQTGIDFRYEHGGSGRFYLPEISCGGAALFDFDGDGDLDVYFVQGQWLDPEPDSSTDSKAAVDGPPRPVLNDRLFRNDLGPEGPRFVDITEASGIKATGYGCGVASGDFDGDGWEDLYVTNLRSNQLWRNRGDGTFEDVTTRSGTDDPRWSTSASFADLDGDGLLDLYIGNYVEFSTVGHKTCRTTAGAADYCDPASYRGVPDRLLRNRGDGTFEDISTRSGIQSQRSKSLGVVIADFNGDHTPDIYVTNDGIANQLWIRGADGRYVDEALLAGNAVNGRGQAEASMGVAAGDFDQDGDLDLFMTHLGGETNTLFVNEGRGSFDDRTTARGLGPPSWPMTGWGTAWIDVENNGRLDLLVVNGAVRTLEALAKQGDPFPFHQTDQLFLQREGHRFAEVSSQAGDAFQLSAVSRGLATGDLDNDGDTDALVVNLQGKAHVLENRIGQDQHWLGLRLEDKKGLLALGAHVTLQQGEVWQYRRIHTDGSFASASDPRLLFGFGPKADPVQLTIRWPDGQREAWQDLPLDRYSTLRQGSGRKKE